MNQLGSKELYFLLDADGAIIAYQEKDQSWAGALAFSSEQLASDFIQASQLEVAEIAGFDSDDLSNVRALVSALKRRPIRYLLLDLNYHTGACRQVDFEGDGLGATRERQFVKPGERR